MGKIVSFAVRGAGNKVVGYAHCRSWLSSFLAVSDKAIRDGTKIVNVKESERNGSLPVRGKKYSIKAHQREIARSNRLSLSVALHLNEKTPKGNYHQGIIRFSAGLGYIKISSWLKGFIPANKVSAVQTTGTIQPFYTTRSGTTHYFAAGSSGGSLPTPGPDVPSSPVGPFIPDPSGLPEFQIPLPGGFGVTGGGGDGLGISTPIGINFPIN